MKKPNGRLGAAYVTHTGGQDGSVGDFDARVRVIGHDCGCAYPDFKCLTKCMIGALPWTAVCSNADGSLVDDACIRLWRAVNDGGIHSSCPEGDWKCLEAAYRAYAPLASSQSTASSRTSPLFSEQKTVSSAERANYSKQPEWPSVPEEAPQSPDAPPSEAAAESSTGTWIAVAVIAAVVIGGAVVLSGGKKKS